MPDIDLAKFLLGLFFLALVAVFVLVLDEEYRDDHD